MPVSGDDVVVLTGGVTARLAPYLLLIRLEAEGFRLLLDAEDHLDVVPGDRLHPDDVQALRRYRHDVVNLLRYVADDRHLFTDRPREVAHA